MDGAKDHRFLTEKEMLSIIESSEAELLAVQPTLDALAEKVFDGGFYEPGTYAKLVKDGVFSSATVRDPDGEPQFILIYSRSPVGWLYVEAVAALKRSSLKQIFGAVDQLAKHYGCKVIQCVTKLSGMLRYSKTAGYRPAGIIILKDAPAT